MEETWRRMWKRLTLNNHTSTWETGSTHFWVWLFSHLIKKDNQFNRSCSCHVISTDVRCIFRQMLVDNCLGIIKYTCGINSSTYRLEVFTFGRGAIACYVTCLVFITNTMFYKTIALAHPPVWWIFMLKLS